MILDRIVAHKREELAHRKAVLPVSELRARGRDRRPPLDLAGALGADGVRLIAEVKRASPSRGLLRPDLDPPRLATAYARGGAAAISVLTDERFFRGSLDDMARVSTALADAYLSLPVLRKDFIIDTYQVAEALAYGADALLLIAAVLSDEQLGDLLARTRDLGLTALVEVHDQLEVDRLAGLEPRVVGVNNRDLQDFTVDLAAFGRLRPLLPAGAVAVAESGVRAPADVQWLGAMGADAVLVGEALVTAPDVEAAVRGLVEAGGHA